jgi:hypothetical protein
MPTSLPLGYSTVLVTSAKSLRVPDPVWFVMIWAAAMSLVTAFADVGAGAAAMDPFQLLAAF